MAYADLQIEKVADLVLSFDDKVKEKLKTKLNKDEFLYLEKIIQGLNDTNKKEIAKNLIKIREIERNALFSQDLKLIAASLLKFLGNPRPILEPGVGYG